MRSRTPLIPRVTRRHLRKGLGSANLSPISLTCPHLCHLSGSQSGEASSFVRRLDCLTVLFPNPVLQIYPRLVPFLILRRLMRHSLVAFVCVLALPPITHAAPGAVRCGKVLDVRSGQMLTDQVVLFDVGGTITSIGSSSSLKLPGGIIPVDLSHATCLPDLIDLHTHLTRDPTGNGYAGLGISIPRE